MKTIKFSSEFFNIKDTLECGQVFRFKSFGNGYLIFSKDKCAFAETKGDFTLITTNDEDYDYFYNYFDLSRDYSKIFNHVKGLNVDILTLSAERGKGIRLPNQDLLETAFSFIISQNNNIKRIKGIIEKFCLSLGDKISFMDSEYYAFPSIEKMANAPLSLYKEIGLGYRAPYILEFAKSLSSGLDLKRFKDLEEKELRKQLTSIYGIGPKVADCIILFGYKKTTSFPVDTWIEKVYRENFNGKLNSREKIAEYFTENFKENSGYVQQYLFHYKRNLEIKAKKQ
jgi:N-glycosylase/DNA lyase